MEPAAAAPEAPATARELFGARLPLVEAFARALAGTGVAHGLIGPREVPRLWNRHLLNCAVVQELIPQGVTVVDVGSGAGLPGIPLAIARMDLDVHLVEPMLRRTTWLGSVIADLGLENVHVHRGRAQDVAGGLTAEVVTARAVASVGELASWCLPLVRSRGRLMALKGASAEEELASAETRLRSLGYGEAQVRTCGIGVVDPPTTVIVLTRVAMTGGGRSGPRNRQALVGQRPEAQHSSRRRTRNGPPTSA